MKGFTAPSIIIALVLAFSFQPVSIAANGKEQGSSNGQPFQTLQSHIDLLASDFNAAIADLQSQIDNANNNLQQQINDLQASQAAQDQLITTIQTAVTILQQRVASNENDIASLQALSNFQSQYIQALDNRLTALEVRVANNENDIQAIILADQTMQLLITAIQGQIVTINAQIAANDGDIAALQAQLATLNTSLVSVQSQLAQKQNRVNGVCNPGYSIRIINSNGTVVCEQDNVSAGVGTLTQGAASNSGEIPGAGLTVGSLSLTATCPSNYTVTGGGFNIYNISGGDPRLVQITRSGPSGNGWNVYAINDNVVILGAWRIGLTSYATCARVQ